MERLLPEAERRREWESVVEWTWFRFCKMKHLEMDGGDGCVTMTVPNTTELHT